MTLAAMLATDQDAFVCDMAETYHIFDYKALPVEMLAVLASGLRDNSRIVMKMEGVKYIAPEMVLPKIADVLTILLYGLAGRKDDLPVMMTDIMLGKAQAEKQTAGFKSGEDFEKAWARIARGDNDG